VDSTNILAEKRLKVTPCRIDVLNYLRRCGRAVGQPELQKFFEGKYDRVTLYRTLHTFLKVDLVHTITNNDNGTIMYALCNHSMHVANSNHNHLHFKCLKCNTITCLNEIELQNFILPQGYNLKTLQIIAIGECPQCTFNK